MFVCFLFSYIGILDPISHEVVIEKHRANETTVPSEQLLSVKEVNEEKRVLFFTHI